MSFQHTMTSTEKLVTAVTAIVMHEKRQAKKQNASPDSSDLRAYARRSNESPFYSNPGSFLREGQRVRAKIRVWDCPQDSLEKNWGWVSALPGELGTVEHSQPGCWPTVRFDETGCSTCVTDLEVEPIDVTKQQETAAIFFRGLSDKLMFPGTPLNKAMSQAFQDGFRIAEAYLKDTQAALETGLSLADYIAHGLRQLEY